MSKNDLAKNSVIPMVAVVRVEPGVQGMDAIPHRVLCFALSDHQVIPEKRRLPCPSGRRAVYVLHFKPLNIYIDWYNTDIVISNVFASCNRRRSTPSHHREIPVLSF